VARQARLGKEIETGKKKYSSQRSLTKCSGRAEVKAFSSPTQARDEDFVMSSNEWPARRRQSALALSPRIRQVDQRS
jgi:hypothetical protein